MGKLFYQVLRPVTNLYTTLVYRPKIYNSEVIPEEGGIILAGNHLTAMDQLVVIKATKRSVRFLAKKELYRGFLGVMLKWYDTIPVERKNKEENKAMELSEEALRKGDAIHIFPEGRRNKTEEVLLPLKYGAVSLAKKTGCYIVPFGISEKLIPFKKGVKVHFGTPFRVDGDLEEANNLLRDTIISLIKKGKQNEKE